MTVSPTVSSVTIPPLGTQAATTQADQTQQAPTPATTFDPRQNPARGFGAVAGCHIIVLGNEKGGSGKSTAAMHIIVGLLRQGYRVGSIDLDGRQGTLTRYFERRKERCQIENRQLPCPEHRTVLKSTLETKAEIEADEQARFKAALEELAADNQIIVIDTPGADTHLNRVGHSYADTLITPINDSFVDLDLLANVDPETHKILRPSVYSEMVWDVRKRRAMRDRGSIDWILMRNRLSHLDARNKRDISDIVETLAKRIGFRMAPGFGERVIFRELFLKGMTLMDLVEEGSSLSMSHLAARQEVRALLDTIKLPNLAEIAQSA